MTKTLFATLIVAVVLTGCNTFKGIGKDVSATGKAVTNTAAKTSDEISRK